MPNESRVVAAIDFGTTFSGFACALRSDKKSLFTNYSWPGSMTAPYAKTLTALKYDTEVKVGHEERVQESQAPAEWGWRAFEASKESASKGYCHRFKLHIAPNRRADQLVPLEPGVTPEKAISDYLRLIGKMAEDLVKDKTGYDKADIQWCLTVPAIWDENAKSIMKKAGKKAGLWRDPEVPGEGSPFPPIVVLEPEAAAFYCSSSSVEHGEFKIEKNDCVLIVDAGGGTVDLVAHRVDSEDAKSFREITQGSGAMCGGTSVDDRFVKHLQSTIHGAKDLLRTHPQGSKMQGRIMMHWEAGKKNFDGTRDLLLDLPSNLENIWEQELRERGETQQADELDGFRISVESMKFIFDPVVDQILSLIQDQLNEIERRTNTQAKVMYLVGGFSESAYLRQRVKRRFNRAVQHIYHPPNPGSAIVLVLPLAAPQMHPMTNLTPMTNKGQDFPPITGKVPGFSPITGK
ncbi:hypothetical protein CYMTET_14524, partial [Cymbomonas tetramitiformis]